MKSALYLLMALLSTLLPTASAQPAAAPLTSWGRYTFQFKPGPFLDLSRANAHLLIKGGTRIVLDVTNVDIDMSLHALRPGGLPELVLTMFSGGAPVARPH